MTRNINDVRWLICCMICGVLLFSCGDEREEIVIPEEPEGLYHTVIDGAVWLYWQPAEHAETYIIYRGTQIDGDFEQIGNSETLSYGDHNVEHGNTYFYKVAGVSSESVRGDLSAPHQVDLPGAVEVSPNPIILDDDGAKSISIRNISARSVAWEASSDKLWILLNRKNGLVEAGQTDILEVSADLSAVNVGEHSGHIQLTISGGRELSVSVKVTKRPYISGKVLHSRTMMPVQDVSISVGGRSKVYPTGEFQIVCATAGEFRLRAEKSGYFPAVMDIEIDESGETDPVVMWLRPIPQVDGQPIGDLHMAFSAPVDVCFSGDNTRAYVSDELGGVSAINALDDVVKDQNNEVGVHPIGIIAHPQKNEVYLADAEAHEVIILDERCRVLERLEVDRYPQQFAITRDGSRLYVTCRDSRSVVVIDTESRQVIKPSFAAGREPNGIVLSHNEQRLYVANSGDDSVSVLDALNGRQLTDPISVASRPQYLAVSEEYLYVSNSFGDEVSVVNQTSLEVEMSIELGRSIFLGDLAVLEEPRGGDIIYVVDQTNNAVRLVNVIKLKNGFAWEIMDSSIPVGDMPTTIAIRPDLAKIYVVNNGSASISVLRFD